MHILGLQKTTLLDYPHKVASTIFTGGCNFRCPYCHNGDLVINPGLIPPYSEDEIFDHLNQKKRILDGVCITGGEPTLQPDLYSFISRIKDLGLLIKLDTNGTNPILLKKLMDDKLIDYVAMDIKQCPAKYNLVACSQLFDFSNIQESISILMNSDIDYEFRTTVASELFSHDDFKEIGQWLKGAKAYYIQSYQESENVIDKSFSPFSKDELNFIINVISPYVTNVSLRGID